MTIEELYPLRIGGADSRIKLYNCSFSSRRFGWYRTFRYLEMYSNRLASNWTLNAAQGRAKDEVLAALFIAKNANSKGVDLYGYFRQFREKTVLVLGAYDAAGSIRIFNICSALTSLGYNAITIKDVPEFEAYDISQKVVAVASVCRFIVMDDSTPSGHLAEFEICRTNRWLMAVLRAAGHGASWMTAGASIASNVVHEGSYDPSNVLPAVTEAAHWAESRLSELERSFDKLYPWRLGVR
jgi:hypothetical protein